MTMNRTSMTRGEELAALSASGRSPHRRGSKLATVLGAVLIVAATTFVAAASVDREAPSPAQDLLLAERPEVAEAMHDVAERLMGTCLNQDQATDLITTTLSSLGVSDFSVRTDGPLVHPIGQGDVVRNHISAGCFVYSGAGQDAGGRFVQYISGP